MDASADDTRLGELLGRYQRMVAEDPAASVESLRADAGPLYEDLRELVTCLDVVLDDGETARAEASATPPATPGRRRWPWLVAILLLGGVALGAWHLLRTPPEGTLVVHVHPDATVLLDGAPLPDAISAGTYALRVEREGFRAVQRQVVVPAGESLSLTLHLEPEDPLAPATLTAIARSHGLTRWVLPPVVAPLEVEGGADTPLPEVTPAGRRALALERQRIPLAVRDWPSLRFVLAERLYRLGHHRIVLQEAEALVAAHPDAALPRLLALHALWGLGRSHTARYAAHHARYLAAD